MAESIDSKRNYPYPKACTGIGCGARFNCGLYFALNYRSQVRELIRPPFINDNLGKFKSCGEMKPIKI